MVKSNIKVRKAKQNTASATDLALMVTSGSEQTIEQYDPEFIVNSLKEELGFSDTIAREITEEVSSKLAKVCEQANITTITTSLIRNFINVILYERGNKSELKSVNSITIPIYDITKTIEMANKENGNLSHGPESINLTIAERIIKDYSVEKIYTKECAKAHREGKIYIHDMGMSNRAYAFDGDRNKITLSDGTEKSIAEIYTQSSNPEIQVESGVVKKENIALEIVDKDGTTTLNTIVKMEEEKDIYEVVLESGHTLYITEEHPCMVYRNNIWTEVPLRNVEEGEEMYVAE